MLYNTGDESLITPLRLIFKNCLRRGIFPETWKRANVVPVHKKNEKNLKENYRPISLLQIFSKILEKLINESLYLHLERENLLNPNQSGFRPGDSTINQLLSITHSIFEAFDCNSTLDVRSFYIDISKLHWQPLTGSGMRVLSINSGDVMFREIHCYSSRVSCQVGNKGLS